MNFSLGLVRKHCLNGYGTVWLTIWKNMPFGTVVSIPWPGIDDPNEIWKPWLEQNVGRQQRSWEWWLHNDVKTVKIRFLKKEDAVAFVMRFG